MVQYNATASTDYLDQLETDWRKETLLELRNLILAQSDNLQEGMQYKMLSYSDSSGTIFHLNAQKHYVSLYVGDINKINPSLDLWAL